LSELFEELDYQKTSLGALSLRRRREPMVANRDVFEVKLDDDFLMSSLFTVGEIALADIALETLKHTEIDVAIGGLGLGFTANAALEHESVQNVVVIEALGTVIDWHRQELVPLGRRLSSDPRCELIQGDFFEMVSRASDAVEPPLNGRKFEAILLDIDHSPNHLLHSKSRHLYTVAGMQSLTQMLRQGGVFAMWSNDPPEKGFSEVLQKVFRFSRAEVIEFPNPYSGDTASCTIYVGKKH
jgi:spermidine synthase